jgi:predicted nucleic acid-binding protein
LQSKIVIDTNIYIDIFNAGRHKHLQNPSEFVVFLAYPVLHELWMGARNRKEIKHLSAFQERFIRLKRLILPSSATLTAMGPACRRLRKKGKLDPAHPKHYNDISIALLARQIGAAVITKNVEDFKAIKATVDFSFRTP